jgi:hypothetical protein
VFDSLLQDPDIPEAGSVDEVDDDDDEDEGPTPHCPHHYPDTEDTQPVDLEDSTDGPVITTGVPTLDRLLSEWESSFRVSVSAMLDRQEQLESTNPGGEWPYQLSLAFFPEGIRPAAARSDGIAVTSKHKVGVIAWSMPSASKGNIITLPDSEHNNTIMALNPTCPKLSDVPFEIILPVIGFRPHRSKERPPLEGVPLRLKTMWMNAANNCASQERESLSLEGCAWCKCGGAFDGASLDEAIEKPVTICAFCLQVSHFACSNRATTLHANYFEHTFVIPMSDAALSSLPDVFKHKTDCQVICGMCLKALSLSSVLLTDHDEPPHLGSADADVSSNEGAQ